MGYFRFRRLHFGYTIPHPHQSGCRPTPDLPNPDKETTILVQAFSFTSAPIPKALINDHKRGVQVEVLLDKSQRNDQYSSATFLFNAGIPTKIDSQHAIAHNKVMVIDGEMVITGSFNFTKAAEENNAENLLIIHDKILAEGFIKNWQEHDKHSEVYVGRTK